MAHLGNVWPLLQHRLWVECGPSWAPAEMELGSEPMSGVIAVAAR